LLSELSAARSADSRLDRHVAALKDVFREPGAGDRDARRVAGGIAVALAAALLLRHAPAPIGEAYCASRLDGGSAGAFGELPASVDPVAIISGRFAA
jgi:putative acyl-CoA dehydrogenase